MRALLALLLAVGGLPGDVLVAPAAAQGRSVVHLSPGSGNDLDEVVRAKSQRGVYAGVVVETRTPWPTAIDKGYFPAIVELENTSGDSRTLFLAMERGNYRSEFRTTRTVRLAPGERQRVELFASAYELEAHMGGWGGASSVLLEVRVAGSDDLHRHPVTLEVDWGQQLWPLVATGARPPSEQGLAALADSLELATTAVDGPTTEVQVSAVPASELPLRLEAYTSLAAFVVDLGAGLPDEDALEPALTWTRLGGTIAFVGEDAADRMRALGLVRPWMRPELRLDTTHPAWHMGHGTLLAFESLGELSGKGTFLEALEGRPTAEPARTEERWRVLPTIPGIERLPYRLFGALMVLFAVIVGPVNFIVLKKLDRNVLLLLTIPCIALVVTGAVLTFGILHRGIDVKRAEWSLTWLDERSHHASTLASRSVFAGLATEGGLRPGSGGVVLPFQFQRDVPGGRFDIGLAPGVVSYTGDFLPARQPVEMLIASDRPARGRLSLERDGEGFRASNELGARVLELFVRTPDDEWFQAEGLEPGATATLSSYELPEPATDLDVSRGVELSRFNELLERAHARGLWDAQSELPRGAWLALVEENPFVDDCAIDSRQYEGWHLVVGLPEGDAWSGGAAEGTR